MSDRLTILQGDCLDKLGEFYDCSVHCCVTSPPYWGLRDYGVDGQIGLEKTPEEYVAKMVAVFREVKRVLRDDGTLWLNLGDSYSGGGNYRGVNSEETLTGKQASNRGAKGLSQKLGSAGKDFGIAPKNLVGIPWRVAFALQADGWYLRSDIIWHKPNPMPESVTDRPTKAHEYIFLLSKSARYYYDYEAIKDPPSPDLIQQIEEGYNGKAIKDYLGMSVQDASATKGRIIQGYRNRIDKQRGHSRRHAGFNDKLDALTPQEQAMCGRNKRSVWTVPEDEWQQFLEWKRLHSGDKKDVWTVPSQPYPDSHFATFPEALIKPCILAGTSAKGCCPHCGAPWERVVERVVESKRGSGNGDRNDSESNRVERSSNTVGWQPGCECGYGTLQPCTVLDPFGGSGTTGKVALELGRKATLIELNPEYVELIQNRTNITYGLQLA